MDATGSMLVVEVVPTVATTASGAMPLARSSAIAARNASGRMRKLLVRRDPAQGALAQAEGHHRLVVRRVRLLGRVDAIRRQAAAREAQRADVRHGRLPRRRQRVQGGDGGGVVDHAFELGRQPEQLPQPAERHLFQLGRRRRRAPEHGLHVQGARQQLRQHAGRAAGDGEVGEEAGMVPVRDAGQEDALEVGEDGVERLAGLRGGRRELRADLPRPGAGQHGVAVVLTEVGRDPVDEVAPVTPELVRRHVAEGVRRLRRHPARRRARTP